MVVCNLFMYFMPSFLRNVYDLSSHNLSSWYLQVINNIHISLNIVTEVYIIRLGFIQNQHILSQSIASVNPFQSLYYFYRNHNTFSLTFLFFKGSCCKHHLFWCGVIQNCIHLMVCYNAEKCLDFYFYLCCNYSQRM